MQTFLPYKDFMESAKVLDKKRCWKQVIEAHQIINCLASDSALLVGWRNHPAVKMWEGHTYWLREYFNDFLEVCIEKHRINTKYDYFYQDLITPNEKPWWLGNEDFHRAMRARLIEKDREFYLPLFPNDEGYNDGKYWWPVMETKTFRII